MTTYADELSTALELADWAAGRIRARPTSVTTKANAADLVTETDREIERRVRSVVAERFPSYALVGEEYGGRPADDGAPTWYLDPVDGTTNYASGLPWCSFSLALADADGPALGVVADPFRGEVFSAVRGGSALCNGDPIRCADATGLAGEVVVTEWAAYRPWPGMTDMLDRLAGQLCTTRIMGSSALSLVSVAAGRAAAGVIGAFNPIDLLAAVFVAGQAGADVRGEDGKRTLFPESGGIMVAAPGVADQVWQSWTGVTAG
ncbi:myo-inositol-1(or 4)-monophosphatase/deoxyribonuclease-2 [Actinopolymorpha cephalotaxi]|uniref:Fructose-1,6-bisphosphatase/inositol monophosphatase family enzyme n=1 Tax=Actinopolymorpha cephalotaxi TaxID=504797 RepID=A0A1I2W2B2_9ACTN|nr:inositol monophosphatase [Actinopolymorpha cephalotaxi]NYH82788.1 fructose-1,6-bisphosphatase/inositol monophosphatase family enzyme [Actinopolymorpha cephalotaxi]SFG95534.1 myo-inositol-1(or 4)-monophosphatase/deoxyribonuclease-2 [Actinopolymorpha cephalotaxi]